MNATSFIQRCLIGLIVILIGAVILLSWVPPVSRDALTHHLFVPKLYIKHGSIHEIPDIPFSYYPMNLDLLYLVPLCLGNDIVPKLIHFAFAVMTAGLIHGYLKKRIGSHYALFGALFFLSLPIIVKLSITVYVDLGLIFFTTAAILLLLKWLESSRLKWLVFSAFMCGLSLGTKYNGLISFLLLTLFIPVAYLRYPGDSSKTQAGAAGYAAFFFLISLTVFSPWMIRNYIWTRNPIYPLFNAWFNPPPSEGAGVSDGVSDENHREESVNALKPFALRKIVYGETWWQLISIPVRIFFEGKDDDPKYFDGKLNPFLLLLPLTLFLGIKRFDPILRFEIKFFALFSAFTIFLVFFQHDMRIRYAGCMIPPMTLLAVFGLRNIEERFQRGAGVKSFPRSSWAACCLAAVTLIPNALYIKNQFHYVNPFSYILGKVSREQYIEKYHPEYRVIRFANNRLPQQSKILFLFIGRRGYYSDREIFFGYDWLKKELQNASSGTSLFHAMHGQGVTHLLLRSDFFLNWLNQELPPDHAKTMVNFMNKHVKLLFSHAGYRLYEVVS